VGIEVSVCRKVWPFSARHGSRQDGALIGGPPLRSLYDGWLVPFLLLLGREGRGTSRDQDLEGCPYAPRVRAAAPRRDLQ